jgi:fatty-acyl-CoA synthase
MTSLIQRLHTVRTLIEAGIVRPARPDKLLRVGLALHRFGPTPAGGYTGAAVRYPDEAAIVDELGMLTFADVHRRTNALAHAFSDAGIVEGDAVAIMCRNHRGFVDATVALSKLGAHALYLNTAFAAPQITDVVKRESPRAIVFDDEFADLVGEAAKRRKRFVAWHEPDAPLRDPTLESMIEEGDASDVVAPENPGRVVILTSGTTGTPKGANRSQPESLDPAAALLSKIPLRARETTMIAAPMFHSWGFAHFSLGMGLASTLVLKRKFDPEATLSLTAQHQASALVVVPVMLQRIVDLGEDVIDRYDLSRLRVIAISGSQFSAALSKRVTDAFGPPSRPRRTCAPRPEPWASRRAEP